MNIHKIDSHLHHSFLEEERKDSVTGDLIQANDEVVFCASCKSAFFKDSWEYMDKKHCGQKNTLKKFPISKILALNVTIIQPNFITLIGISISVKECLELFSDFQPTAKKADINLPNSFRTGRNEYQKIIAKNKQKVEEKIPLILTKKHKRKKSKVELMYPSEMEGMDLVSFLFVAAILFGVGMITVVPLLETTLSQFIGTIVWLYISGVLAFGDIKYSIKSVFKRLVAKNEKTTNYPSLSEKVEKNTLLQGISEAPSSVTFGIFHHNLFFYFEKHNIAIFLDIKKIAEFEFEYKTDTYIHISLKSEQRKFKSVSIPLIFSKEDRITKFLLRLVKAKDDIKNKSKIIVKEFPISIVHLLKKKFITYNKFVFVEEKAREKVQRKK